MALYLVATPIGHSQDITLRALELLRQTPLIIGEEKKEVGRLIARYQLGSKEIALLNEHSTPADVADLTARCAQHDAVLVSDCGTPSFCDPGFQLVDSCRARGIRTIPVPGPSSLMALLTLADRPISEFYFRGFLPANTSAREAAWQKLKNDPRCIILLDTPYRLARTLTELAQHSPERRILLGLNLTQEDEEILQGPARQLAQKVGAQRKAEFILLLYPLRQASKKIPSVDDQCLAQRRRPGGR